MLDGLEKITAIGLKALESNVKTNNQFFVDMLSSATKKL